MSSFPELHGVTGLVDDWENIKDTRDPQLGSDPVFFEGGSTQNMRCIVASRRFGKTARVIQWLLANPEAVVVVSTMAVAEIYLQSGIEKNRILSASNVQRLRGSNVPIAVDDADMVLSVIFGRYPALMTVNI